MKRDSETKDLRRGRQSHHERDGPAWEAPATPAPAAQRPTLSSPNIASGLSGHVRARAGRCLGASQPIHRGRTS